MISSASATALKCLLLWLFFFPIICQKHLLPFVWHVTEEVPIFHIFQFVFTDKIFMAKRANLREILQLWFDIAIPVFVFFSKHLAEVLMHLSAFV